MSAESELVRRCLAGDSQAWDTLFQEHYPATGRFVFQISPDLRLEDVEEISQEVFLSVIKNLHAFNGKSRLQTWIYRIAVNKTHDFIEKQHAAKRGGGQITLSLQEENPEGGLAYDPPSPGVGPDLSLENRERLDLLARTLHQLGHPCAELIELRYFADLSYEEISAESGLNPKTVSSRLSKCLDKLEALVKKSLSAEESGGPSV